MNINLDKTITKKCTVVGCNHIAWEYCLLTYSSACGHCVKHCGCPENYWRKKQVLLDLRQQRLC